MELRCSECNSVLKKRTYYLNIRDKSGILDIFIDSHTLRVVVQAYGCENGHILSPKAYRELENREAARQEFSRLGISFVSEEEAIAHHPSEGGVGTE